MARVIEEADRLGRRDISDELEAFLIKLLDTVVQYRTDDGRFHDILDDPGSFIDGTSAMMMAATIYRGIKHGYISGTYRDYADRAVDTVSAKIDAYGLIREVSGCPDFISEGTSAEAQAAYIMAVSWRH